MVGLSACLDPGRVHRPGQDYHYLSAAYAEAVSEAGGVPVMLPVGGVGVVARLDALVVTGGDDLDPATYGAERHPTTRLEDPRRVAWDRRLLDAALSRQMPVLGICYGMQLLNVHLGGSLHQVLPDGGVDHGSPGAAADHAVRFEAGFVRAAHGADAAVLRSAHRQGVDRLGAGVRATGFAADGLVEAIEFGSAVGVEWHPERSQVGRALLRAWVRLA